jgi:hypothetical protein
VTVSKAAAACKQGTNANLKEGDTFSALEML